MANCMKVNYRRTYLCIDQHQFRFQCRRSGKQPLYPVCFGDGSMIRDILYGANISEGSLPANGAVTSKNGITNWQIIHKIMQHSWKKQNSATLEFETEQRANSLYFLGNSANGTFCCISTANYTDGTSASAGNITIGDWFGSKWIYSRCLWFGTLVQVYQKLLPTKLTLANAFRLFECPVRRSYQESLISYIE